jgi:uncharacterized linocin/CFP29 family protein
LPLLVGRNESELQPIKDAARRIAFTEDATIFEGYAEAGIEGIVKASRSSSPACSLRGIGESKHLIRLPETGVEPATRALRMRCSTN